MPTARVVKSGHSQIIKFPEGFDLKAKEVEILRDGDAIVLRPIVASRNVVRRKTKAIRAAKGS